MTNPLTQADLDQFTGTEQYYRHWLVDLVYTDGVRYLVDKAGAYWLVDAIAVYQTKQLLEDPELKHFQLWKLEVKDNTGVLTCQRDEGEAPRVRQVIDYTDFPLPEVTLYLIDKVLLLPSEY